MGGCYRSTRIPFCSEKELGRHFADLQQRDREEFGWEPYSGSWATIHDLAIESNRTFFSVAEADAYLSDVEKRTAVAVILVLTKPSAAALQSAQRLREKARILASDKLYPLTGQAVSGRGHVSPPSWEREFATAIVNRVRTAKSRTKGCDRCGSSIAVSHIHRLACPVCGAEFLLTESDRRRRDTLKSRIVAVETKLRALHEQANRIERDGRTLVGDQDRFWYIGGVAAE